MLLYLNNNFRTSFNRLDKYGNTRLSQMAPRGKLLPRPDALAVVRCENYKACQHKYCKLHSEYIK